MILGCRCSSKFVLTILILAGVACFYDNGWAASIVWNFDQSNLSYAYADDGATAQMTYFDYDPNCTETIEQATSFGITGGGSGTPPNMADGAAHYLHHGVLPNDGRCGYAIGHTGFQASTCDGRMQAWTMVYDLYIPQASSGTYNAMFHSDAELVDGAEWYLRPGGFLGHSDLGITTQSAFSYDQWHRIGLVYDRPNARVEYWVDGTKVFDGSDVADDRYLLWASEHAGTDLVFQGDNTTDSPSYNYTSEAYISSLAFSDFAYSNDTMQSLGTPTASGVPLVRESLLLGTLNEFTLPSQLDLEGNIRYAINLGSESTSYISGVPFLGDQSEIIGFASEMEGIYSGARPEFGDSPNIDTLEDVLETASWHYATEEDLDAEITLAVTPGKTYKLQLLFWKSVPANRWFDVSVEGQLVLDEFNPIPEEDVALVYTYEFVAGEDDDVVTILFEADGDPVGLTRHPILNALTLEEIRTTWIPGDIDGDEIVDDVDLGVLRANWGQSGLEWENGDFNDDGCVDVEDIAILAAQWGDHRAEDAQTGNTTPEPFGLVVLFEALLLLVLRRQR